MNSPALALTWEFWRRGWRSWLATVALMGALASLVYSGLQIERVTLDPAVPLAMLHSVCFVFLTLGLAAAAYEASGSVKLRFTLPISARTTILVPAINGAVAVAFGYLMVATVINLVIGVSWPLLKPALGAVCMYLLSQSIAWVVDTSDWKRGGMLAVMFTVLTASVSYSFGMHAVAGEFISALWLRITIFDWCLGAASLVVAGTIAFAAQTCGRRGQGISFAAIWRFVAARFDFPFRDPTHLRSPMSAELWSEWLTRGLAMPAIVGGAVVVVWCFFLSGRVAWTDAVEGVIAVTGMGVLTSALVGLFVGHPGERFDIDEFTATRPLSDRQLADVKLWNVFKGVIAAWIVWVTGLAVGVLYLTMIGHGPSGWRSFLPPSLVAPDAPPYTLTVWYAGAMMAAAVIASWTFTGLSASAALLRDKSVFALVTCATLGPCIILAVFSFFPDIRYVVAVILFWTWIILTTRGSIVLFAAAYFLNLITARRILIIALGYVVLCGIVFTVQRFLPPSELDHSTQVEVVLSICVLPFIPFAAIPLAIRWNRHR